jgi:hypothetical protein
MPKFNDGLTEFNYRIEGIPHDDIVERRLSAMEEVNDKNIFSMALALHKRFPHWYFLMPHGRNARRFCKLIFFKLDYKEAPLQSSMSLWDRMANIIHASYRNPCPIKTEDHPYRRAYKIGRSYRRDFNWRGAN